MTNGGFDAYIPNGQTYTYTPSMSVLPDSHNFYLDCHPDEAVINPKTGQVILDTSLLTNSAGVKPNTSHYLIIQCKNSVGEDEIVIRLHIGITASDVIFSGAGQTYSTLKLACNHANANSNIKRIIIKNGLYTDEDDLLAYRQPTNGISADYHAPSGTAQSPFIVMAETPFEVVFDGEAEKACLQIFGDDLHPDFQRGSNASDLGANSYSQNHLHVFGIVPQNSFRGAEFRASEYNIFRFCDFGGVGFLENNTNCGAIINTQKGLMEYCYTWGWSRYCLTAFEVLEGFLRRCIARYGGYSSNIEGALHDEPSIAGMTLYSCQRSEMQNCGVIDSTDLNIFSNFDVVSNWPTSHQITEGGGPQGYSQGLAMRKCWAINVFNGGSTNFAQGQNVSNANVVEDFLVYGTTIPGLVHPTRFIDEFETVIFGRGEQIHDRVSILRSNLDKTGPDAGGMTRTFSSLNLSNYILDLIDNTYTGALFSKSGGGQITVDKYSAFGLTNPVVPPGVTDNTSNRMDYAVTLTNGFKYAPRMEEGSIIHTAFSGNTANVEYCVGRLGAYYEDTNDYKAVTETPVWPYKGSKRAMKRWRERTLVFPTINSGPAANENVSGNFGIATVDEDPNYYVWAQEGNTLFPFHVNAVEETTTSIWVSWDIPVAKYYNSWVKFLIQMKNITDSETLFSTKAVADRFDNSVIVNGLISGKTYEIGIVVLDVNGNSSSLSYTCEVSLS